MYRLKIKDKEFTIKKENIGMLAISKAIDTGYDKPIKNEKQAIEFLEKLGVEVINK